MEPFTIGLMILATHVARKIQNSSRRPKCRWCAKEIAGSASSARCCDSELCETCMPLWQQAGGNTCIFCHNAKR